MVNSELLFKTHALRTTQLFVGILRLRGTTLTVATIRIRRAAWQIATLSQVRAGVSSLILRTAFLVCYQPPSQ